MGWFDEVVNSPAAALLSPPIAINQGLRQITGGAGKDQYPQIQGSNAAARNADLEAGYAKGRDIFYNDPDMQELRKRRDDLSKGYSGSELGALRGQAQSELEGQRQNTLRSVAGKAARGGVGGARAAAIQGAADVGLQQNRAELERKMALDNANLVRGGTKDLQDFIMGQKYGELGTGLGYAQLGVSDRSADAQAAAANRQQPKGLVTSILDPLIGGIF